MKGDHLVVFESSPPNHPSAQATTGSEDMVGTGKAGTLVPEVLVRVIEWATYTPEDDELFWLHTYVSETMMLDEDHPQHLQQYMAVNRWWRRVIKSFYPVDIHCQTTAQMEQAVDDLVESDIRSIRTLIWDHELSGMSRPSSMPRPKSSDALPSAATQTALLKRLLKQIDGRMTKALILNYVMLDPLFDVTVYRGWANVTHLCYGTDNVPECFHILTGLLCEFRNLQSLLLINMGGYGIPSLFPPRPTYSLTTFQLEGMDDVELVRWATGDSRKTVDELCWLTDEEVGSVVFEGDLSDVFPGESQLSLRRLKTYTPNFRLIGHCDLNLLVWIQLYPLRRFTPDMVEYCLDFAHAPELLEELSKCKALERLWIGFSNLTVTEGILALLLEGAWPALAFLQVTITDDRQTEDEDEMTENLRVVLDLRKVCTSVGRNIELDVDISTRETRPAP